jgi:hypothetical protein
MPSWRYASATSHCLGRCGVATIRRPGSGPRAAAWPRRLTTRRQSPPLPALGAERGGEFRPQHLHRHLAVQLQVLGQVDGCHPTTADLPLDRVAVSEGGLEAFQ